MALISITEVRPLLEATDKVRFALDRPRGADNFEEPLIEIAGWVTAPQGALKVQIWNGTRLLRTVAVGIPRPDVAASLPSAPANCGFTALLGVANLPADFELRLRVVGKSGLRYQAAVIRGHHGRLPSSFEPTLQPAIVTTLGRMGSTWLMRLLSRHPAIVTHDRYPYETRYAMYWLHAARVLAEPADPIASASREDFNKDLKKLGHNPFFAPPLSHKGQLRQWFSTTYTSNVIGFCQWNIEAYYREIVRRQREQGVRYFTEKFQPDELPDVAWATYPGAREVILVRDFRDVATSIFAFNAKRGNVRFGRERVATDAEFIRKLGGGARQMVHAWQSRRNVARLVRYEDLVVEPRRVLAEIFDYLGLERDPQTISAVVAAAESDSGELDKHRTSTDPTSSIGRWRRDLDPMLWEACRAHLGPALEELGYPPE